MAREVDFLPVGTGSSSGDAIAMRFGNLSGRHPEQTVVIIDGGYADDGKALVNVVRDDYGTDRVDVVIATHHDNDHLNGLSTVLSELEVGELWINIPDVSPATAAMRADSQTSEAARRKLLTVTASLTSANNLVDVAGQFDIPVKQALAGQALVTSHGTVSIVGPDEAYYSYLAENFTVPMNRTGMFSKAVEVIRTVFESLDHETLGEDSSTSASNNSSAITLVNVDGESLLFTGDAGAEALHRAADLLEAKGIAIKDTLRLMQVPHHGSKRNSTPSMLDRFLGPRGQTDSGVTAVVSCAPDGAPKHPAKKVTNAFNRRGATVATTAGNRVLHRQGIPMRPGFVPITPVPFYSQVEE